MSLTFSSGNATNYATNDNNLQPFMKHLSWIDDAKDRLKEGTVRRLHDRLDRLEHLINNGVSRYGPRFIIHQTLKQKICDQLLAHIDQFQGTKKMTKGEVSSKNDVISMTRTWWHRNKSLRLGSHLFAVICFSVLHQFVWSQCVSLTSPQKLVLFIDIFRSFMNATIKFPKTKPKPLIMQQCFLCDSVFKDLCSAFITIFGDQSIDWECNVKTRVPCIENGKKRHKYIKQKDRSQTLYNEFDQCLDKLKQKWSIYGAHNVYNVDIDALMNKWNAIIHQRTPTQYSLSFVHSDKATVPPLSVPDGGAVTSAPYHREFQTMGTFGRKFHDEVRLYPAKKSDDDKLSREFRQQQHIEAMQNNARYSDSPSYFEFEPLDDEFIFFPFTDIDCESENPVTYNVI